MEGHNEREPGPATFKLPLSHYPARCDSDDFLDGLVLGYGTEPLVELVFTEPEITDQDDMKDGVW